MKQVILALLISFCWLAECYSEPYFPGSDVPPTLINKPSESNSEEIKKEMEMIILLQKNARSKDLKAAEAEYFVSEEIIARAVDKNLNKESFPKLYFLLARVSETTQEVTKEAKNYWHEKRPYQIDKRIKPLIKTHSNNGYPSGHTSRAYAMAHILGLLIPQKRDAFYQRAAEVAQHRVLTGMHFVRDVEGGKQIALLVVGGLLQNAEFKKDFAAARDEISTHTLLQRN